MKQSSPANTFKTDPACIGFLVILVLAFFYNPLFTGNIFYHDDIGNLNVPQKRFMLEMSQEGAPSMWFPYFYSGQPFLADNSTEVFYPPNWMFYFVQPERGIVYFIVLHFILAAVFTYILLRKLKLEPLAATTGAVVYTFSGLMVYRIVHLPVIVCAALLPLVFIALLHFLKRKDPASTAALALTFAIYVFSGFYQLVQYMFILAGLFILFQINWKNPTGKDNLKTIGFFILAVVLALGITACATVPGYEFIKHSPRVQGLSYADATRLSMGVEEILINLVPGYFGDTITDFRKAHIWELCYRTGILPLLLLVFIIFSKLFPKNKKSYAFAAVGVLSILLALGRYTPVYWLFYKFVPFFKSHRIPLRYLSGTVLALAVFAGYAVNAVMKSLNKDEDAPPLKGFYAAAAVVAMIAVTVLIKPPVKDARLWPVITAAAASLAMLYAATRSKVSAKVFAYIAVGVAVFSGFAYGFNVTPTAGPEYFTQKARIFAPFKNRAPTARVHYFPPFELKNTLNLPAYRQASNVVGYNPLVLGRYIQYLLWADYKRIIDADLRMRLIKNANMFPLVNTDREMIRLLNVSGVYIFHKAGSRYRVGIKTNTKRHPRVFYVKNHRVIKDELEVLKALRSPSFNPRREIILEEAPEATLENPAGKAPVTANNPVITHYEPDYLKISVNPPYSGFLFLSEVYYPGWKAMVDGKERKIHRGNYTFRAVAIKPGDRSVEVIFEPQSVKTGRTVSIVFILITMGMAATGLVKGKPN